MELKRRLVIKAMMLGIAAAQFPPLVYGQQAQSLLLRYGLLKTQPRRVLSAGRVSDVILMALCPDKLIGMATEITEKHRFLSQQIRRIPYVGRIAGRGSTTPAEKIIALAPDLILDVGDVSPTFVATAEKISAQTQMPYFILSGQLAQSPQQFQELGDLLDMPERAARLAEFSQQILRLTHQVCAEKHLSAYLARSADGLETALPGAIHMEVAEWLGLHNAAAGAGQKRVARVSMENLLQWQPDVILTQDRQFYRHVHQDPLWATLNAVKNRCVFLAPSEPFGWLDAPPSVNRLLGCLWLTYLLAPDVLPADAFMRHVRNYFQLFYGYAITDAEIGALLGEPAP